MPAEASQGKLQWENETTPVSSRFDDPYYSRADGLAESRHVFLDGNDLAGRLSSQSTLHVAELGFGTGLNLCALAQLAKQTSAHVRFTSFELYPLSRSEIVRALGQWPELASIAEALATAWPFSRANITGIDVEVVPGDVRVTLPIWRGRADAWFLDGFSPAKNPEMWTPDVLQQVGAHTSQGGTFATYTAAGHVRRALIAAGFEVTRLPGFGRKREMLAGRLS